MNKPDELEKHDARQSAYRGQGKDAQEDGHGRHDPSAADERDAAPDATREGDAPAGQDPSRDDASTQPNFGQSGSYGQAGDIAEHTARRDD